MFDEYVSTDDIQEYFVFKQVLEEPLHKSEKLFTYNKINLLLQNVLTSKNSLIKEKNQLIRSQNIQKLMLNHDIYHPNIVQVYEVYDNADYFYIVMEYMEGGQLCDQKNLYRCKTQGQICQIVRTITDALDFCHSKKIVHRDMKPENILWSTNDSEAILKIADFGFAKISTDSLMTTACGTPMFFSPQILQRKPYSRSVDYWSLGVITYILLSGKCPFEADDQDELFTQIRIGQVEFPQQYWKYISTSAKDFILKLLEKNPKYRYQAQDIRRHPWINADHTQIVSYVEREQNIWQFEAERKIQKIRNIINLTLIDIRNNDSQMQIDPRLSNSFK